ncbi:hsp70 family protein [Azoarcus sp. L1K30]|uniref:Hsp70 family protein n=1 Tax=Azoarcus sp. L1K30 TaxID=2820277 RepID=UPI001B829B11|nr:Hsp70 family protein [Azoarcus sp. L1K30]MBR0566079.1 hsp70 family protein [Azoarcus sp. L1K30]
MTRYRVGIDLGTSNTVVAYAAPGSDDIQLLPIAQLVAPGAVAARSMLPSVRYHPAIGELAAGDTVLPWAAADLAGVSQAVVGSLARELGAQVPGRGVSSAKSWLSHAAVDRLAPILPWGAADDVAKVSPLVASASYLAHVRAAWQQQFPLAPLEAQEIVLTVPASFDEGARALTVDAARMAGLPTLRLLEEPQAASYDWLFRHRETLADALRDTRLLLVCDVGGGTTDLTLIQVEHDPAAMEGMPRLTRIGVGEHLMLGGDNMDLALAHLLEPRLSGGGAKLTAARFSQLVQRCRAAKERLLAEGAPERVMVTLLGSGAKLVGGARSTELTRDEVVRLIVDGFFPLGAVNEQPRRRRAGIVEFGLPYPADAAVTRHVAAFLARHATVSRVALGDRAPGSDAVPVPDTVLLNGGVFRAGVLGERLVDVFAQWRGARPRVLANDTEIAVARGAVAYALVREGRAPAIGGGSPRSYFLRLDDPADSGDEPRGICILPRGTDEGHEVHLHGRRFALRLGQPVRFHLLASSADTVHLPGTVVSLRSESCVRLPPIATVVGRSADEGRGEVAVELIATMTEVGTLQMHCVAVDDPQRRWLLEFELRGDASELNARGEADAESGLGLPARFGDAVALIDRVFGDVAQGRHDGLVRQLRGDLESLLGRRESWDMTLARGLCDALLERVRRRRRSPAHERVWLNLTGFCLRPGYGAPLDDWRVAQLWPIFAQGLQYVNERQNWSEWWTLWRRAAAGLEEAGQLVLLETLANQLEEVCTASRRNPKPAHAAYDDMVRLAASLERVPIEHKVEVGRWLLERLALPAENPQGWWALGRVGAREPLHASAHTVVPIEVAGGWLDAVLALDWKKVEPAAFAAAQLARYTGDRARDVAPEVREEVAHRLAQIDAPESWVRQVRERVALDEADHRRVFGESLPAGLRLMVG